MDCREWISAVVENARAGRAPSVALRAHLNECTRCSERWREERILTREMQILADRMAGRRSPARVRESLEKEFERHRRIVRARRTALVFAAAAAVVMVFALGLVWWPGVSPATAPQSAQAIDSDFGADAGFVPVPGALPLADGEFVRVERTELEPAALARMGLPLTDPNDDNVIADVLYGEDGLPRAVRVEADDAAVD
jgi:hypothetical protein